MRPTPLRPALALPRAGAVATALTTVALLAGCMHTPHTDARAALPDLPTAWRTRVEGPEAAALTAPAAAIPADWWTAFGDPVLDALVERALARNPDLATAAARVREARAQEALARSQTVPSLDLAVSASRARSLNAFGRPTTATSSQPVFQAAYEVDLFDRIGQQLQAARASREALQAAQDAARLSIAAATASGYITLRAQDARLAVLQDTLQARAEALRVARRRADAGYTSDLELRQAEAEYAAAAQQVPQARLAIERQEHALALLTGAAPGDIPRGASLARLQPLAVPAGLPSTLLRRRPDIAQAELNLAAADASLAAARAQFMPSLRLTATSGSLISSALSDPVAVWTLGASVLAPLFNGGRLAAQADAADARREQALLAYQRTVLTALREVEDALSATVRSREQRKALQAQRTALVEALGHADRRYRAGYTSYLEQLDAQRGVLAADLALVQAAADELTARVALAQAMGGGWQAGRTGSQPHEPGGAHDLRSSHAPGARMDAPADAPADTPTDAR